jgi:type III pantothenate kinase
VTVIVDIGNTRIKWARAETGRVAAPDAAAHEGKPERAFAALEAGLEWLVRAPSATAPQAGVPESLVAVSVCDAEFRARFNELARARWSIEVRWVQSAASGFGVRCGYRDYRRLGVDRWVALIAARQLGRSGVCIVDAGTTVTFDAMDADGVHLGGLIMPGPRLAAQALDAGTAGIGPTPLRLERPTGLALLGRSTEEAVSHAALLAVAAAVDRAVSVVAGAWGAPPRVLLTGGDAPELAAWLECAPHYRPDLVLEGLAFIVSQS